MRILIRQENFRALYYDLHAGVTTLSFAGAVESFSLPYPEVRDFCIAENGSGKTYFTLSCGHRMLEGQRLESEAVDAFTESLRKKLGGVIHIEVKRN